jgi:PAS domain S-box-containing protein
VKQEKSVVRPGSEPDRLSTPEDQRSIPNNAGDGEQIARLVTRDASEAIIATDFDGNVIFWNPAAERMYGWMAEEMVGHNVFDRIARQPGQQAAIERTRLTLNEMRKRERWTRDVVVVRKDGSTFDGEINLSQLRNESGDLVGVVAMTSDISDRRRTEQRLAIQYAVTRLLSGADSVEEAASGVLQAICDELGWDWAGLWLVDRRVDGLTCIATWEDPAAALSVLTEAAGSLKVTPGAGVIGRVWATGDAEWMLDPGQDRTFLRRNAAFQAGIVSTVAVPIQSGSPEVRGVIEIMSRSRVAPEPEMLDMVSAAARQMGLFLERQQARETLIENEARLRRLEESDLIGIIRANLDGTISDANDAFLAMIGYTREDLEAGLRWDEMTPNEWRQVDQEIINDVLTTGRSPQKEKEYVRKDGSRVSVLLGSARLDPDAEDVVTFVVDITARKQAEREREMSLIREQNARRAASDAHQKAEQLLRVTAAFSRARTPEEIAGVTINEGMAVIGASGCSFTLISEDGDGLRLVDATGYGPGTMDRWKDNPLPLDQGFPVTECVLRGESIWVRSRDDLFERFPVTRTITFAFSASIAAIPLMSAGRAVGAINLGFEEEHDFSESERTFIETLVQFCSQALERAWLYEAERRASEIANVAQRRAEQLLEVTAQLSRALTPLEVATTVVDQGLAVLGVQGGVVALLDRQTEELQVIHSRGYPEDTESRWRAGPIPLDRQVPLTDAVNRAEPVWVYSLDELYQRYPLMRNVPGITATAYGAIPLVSDSRIAGVLGLTYSSAERLGPAERTYARTLARLTSQALERAQLFELEQVARVAAERAQKQLALLAEAGELLTSSLDTSTTLDLVARLLVPSLADWCVVDIVGKAHQPERVTVVHVDPDRVRWAEELQQRYPYDPDDQSGLANVLRTGKPELYSHISDDMIAGVARDEEHLQILSQVGFQSVMIVPMVARGRTMGAITLVYAESGRHYSVDDLALVEDLAYRAALAIDNARLYGESQMHAERMDAIAEASRMFAEAGHDIQVIVESLARHVTEHVGDWSVVRLPSDDGRWLNPVAINHHDPEAAAALSRMFAQDPLRFDEGVTGRVASTGEAAMISSIDPEMLRQRIKPEYRHFMDRYSMYAVLIVPMRRNRNVVGTIAMFRGTPERPYTEEDRRFVQNVADRAALALENAQLFYQTQEAVRLREEFLSIASHEMRTPLTSITGFAHLINRQAARGSLDPARTADITSSLLSEAIRLEQLVTDLLDVSRIQQGRLDIRPEPCNLADIIRTVVERLGGAHEHDANREIRVHAPQVLKGIWDATRIDQVVTNLVTNALKYSTDGPIILTLQSQGDGSVLLSVADSGIGIPPEQQEQVFEPFSRGSEAHHQASGTGLGLYITRQIVQHHGGTIELESEAGAGTTFHVRLPLDSSIPSSG